MTHLPEVPVNFSHFGNTTEMVYFVPDHLMSKIKVGDLVSITDLGDPMFVAEVTWLSLDGELARYCKAQ